MKVKFLAQGNNKSLRDGVQTSGCSIKESDPMSTNTYCEKWCGWFPKLTEL